jgi:hypothetical protein
MAAIPSTIKIKQGMALRTDFAGVAFLLLPADLYFAMFLIQCRSINKRVTRIAADIQS